jgi:hypothetical protein
VDLKTIMAARLGDRVVVATDIWQRLRGMGYEDLQNAVEVMEKPGLHPDIRAWAVAAFLNWVTAPDPRSCVPVQESKFVEPGQWIVFRGGQMVAIGRLNAEREVSRGPG